MRTSAERNWSWTHDGAWRRAKSMMGLSDLLVAGTLLVNACAVLNISLKKEPSFDDAAAAESVGERVREFLRSLRYFRIFIGLWNLLMLVCMIFLFS